MSPIEASGRKKYAKALARLAEVVRLYLLGVTPNEIARRLGRSSHEILAIVERHRLRTALPETSDAAERAAPRRDLASCAPFVPERKPLPQKLLADLGRASAHELARRHGVSEDAVRRHRRKAGLCVLRKPERPSWKPWMLEMLGRHSDGYVSRRTGIHVATVGLKRRLMGRPALEPSYAVEWTPEALSWLGKRSDAQLARA